MTSNLVGTHTLNPTTDLEELATRTSCTNDGHPRATYNPWHDATWCLCGAVVTEGDSAPIPARRHVPITGKFDRPV